MEKRSKKADWLLGADIIIENNGMWMSGKPNTRAALRSMSDPGTAYRPTRKNNKHNSDIQPADLSSKNEFMLRAAQEIKDQADDPTNFNEMPIFYTLLSDTGGVHIMSGIPNRAFYLFCKSFGDDSKSWETAGQVWYHALTSPQLKKWATFYRFAKITIESAKTVSGKSEVVTALILAWQTVGVLTSDEAEAKDILFVPLYRQWLQYLRANDPSATDPFPSDTWEDV